ncbi:MAG TPA: zinc ribbon domain-containing protein, partial [Blastocatellia bacterium]
MFCPDCGTENSRSQKFCTRCGTNLIAIDRAREIVSEMEANISAPPASPSSILKIVTLISAIGFVATTAGTIAMKGVAGPLSIFFALGGFTALIMICRYLLQMITPTAKTQMNWQAART